MPLRLKAEPKQRSSKEKPKDQKKFFHRVRDLFRRKHVEMPQSSTKKPDHQMPHEPIMVSEKERLPQSSTTKPDHQMPHEPIMVSEKERLSQNSTTKPKRQTSKTATMVFGKDGVDLREDCFYEEKPIEVDIEHLPSFLTMDIESAIKLSVQSRYCFNSEKQNYYLKALLDFLLFWDHSEFFENGFPKKEGSGFLDFCKEKFDLFERFFPLPKKYRLLAEGLAKIIHEDKIYCVKSESENDFSKYNAFTLALNKIAACGYLCLDEVLFERPDDCLSFLKKENLLFSIFCSEGPEEEEKYAVFETKLKELLKKIKDQNISEDLQEIEDKAKAVVESNINKNSVSGKESFFDVMKNEVRKYRHLKKSDIDEIRSAWRKVKKNITETFSFVETLCVSVNNNEISEEHISSVAEFLEFIVKESDRFFLPDRCFRYLPDDSKIRQHLFITAFVDLAACGSFFNKTYEMGCALGNLRDFFGGFTKKEKMAALCAEIKYEEKSFPLLPLLFLSCQKILDLLSVLEYSLPKIFDIRFQIKGEKEECNIIELLEKMKTSCDRFVDKDGSGEEKTDYASFSESLDKLTVELRDLKKRLDPQEKEAQEAQEAWASKPSTSIQLMGQVEEKTTEKSNYYEM